MSSPNGVWGEASADIEFGAIWQSNLTSVESNFCDTICLWCSEWMAITPSCSPHKWRPPRRKIVWFWNTVKSKTSQYTELPLKFVLVQSLGLNWHIDLNIAIRELTPCIRDDYACVATTASVSAVTVGEFASPECRLCFTASAPSTLSNCKVR